MYKEPGVNPIPTTSDQLLRLGDVPERGSAHGDEGRRDWAADKCPCPPHSGRALNLVLVDGQRLVQQHGLNNGRADAQAQATEDERAGAERLQAPAAQGPSVFASKEPDGGRGHAQNQNRGQLEPWFPGQIPDQSLLPISGLIWVPVPLWADAVMERLMPSGAQTSYQKAGGAGS